MIDHTLLKPYSVRSEIEKLCREAAEYKFASVCVNPYWVSFCASKLTGSGLPVCSVVGFPLGANTTETKSREAQQAVLDGAEEIDTVMNIGAFKEGLYSVVHDDIAQVVDASEPAHVKVIIETCFLSDYEKVAACVLAQTAGAHFVKTSTGFGEKGAVAHDVALMRRVVGHQLGVKAAGGIRSYQDAVDMIQAGANRLGASAGIEIVSGAVSR
ncbi:MAG: deoxyribose-phosphate aldolase [candidate division KSB1 bacterium]|nr:deoxyribose-phosphate aldolase [candidate division KSB1 bacterium]